LERQCPGALFGLFCISPTQLNAALIRCGIIEEFMNIIIITQDDPFFLSENIGYLLEHLPPDVKITGCVLNDVSPFGKSGSLPGKFIKTLGIFGVKFTFHYGIEFIVKKFAFGTGVRREFEKRDIPIIKLKESINSPNSLDKIRKYNPDLLISIAGNQIFKNPLIELAPQGCLNLHTALLPKYRGLMPSFWVLKNDEKETGVSVFFVDRGIDSGPVIVQKKISITKGMTQSQLIKISKKIGMDAVIEAVNLIKKGGYQLIPNPENEKTYFSFPARQDVKEFYKSGRRFY
jgi:methionyl-tRNA formyltransferase